MTKPITAATALRLAREALEDDKKMTPGPWASDGGKVRVEPPPDGWTQYTVAETDRHHPFVRREREPAVDAAGIAASRTREPQLARFVEAVLAALDRVDHANYRDRSGMAAETAKYFEGWTDAVDEIWRLARAADAAEAKEPG